MGEGRGRDARKGMNGREGEEHSRQCRGKAREEVKEKALRLGNDCTQPRGKTIRPWSRHFFPWTRLMLPEGEGGTGGELNAKMVSPRWIVPGGAGSG